MERKKLTVVGWDNVEDYLKKETDDATKLAAIEAEKVFLRVVDSKGYKCKNREEKLSQAFRELKNPEFFLKSREKALQLFDKIGSDFGDPYSGREVVESYREAIGDLLFGIIEGKKLQSLKYRFWPFYFAFYRRRSIIKKISLIFVFVVAIMLFIADTSIGRNLFDSLIDKIHFIIRAILVLALVLFSIFFFIVFSLTILESRARQRVKKK